MESFCRLLKICIVWTLLKMVRLGDMVLHVFACLDEWQLVSFSTKNMPIVLDTITNDITYLFE